MTLAAHNALRALSPEECAGVCAIGVDATGSTVCPADRKGSPLALSESFEENPNAMFHLWKDHTAIKEAAKANTALSQWPDDDYARYQGSIHLSGSGPRRCAPPESILLLGALPGVG
jgi:L-ribulokinase